MIKWGASEVRRSHRLSLAIAPPAKGSRHTCPLRKVRAHVAASHGTTCSKQEFRSAPANSVVIRMSKSWHGRRRASTCARRGPAVAALAERAQILFGPPTSPQSPDQTPPSQPVRPVPPVHPHRVAPNALDHPRPKNPAPDPCRMSGTPRRVTQQARAERRASASPYSRPAEKAAPATPVSGQTTGLSAGGGVAGNVADAG